ELRALTLPESIPGETNEAAPGQRNQNVLPVRIRFAAPLMAQRKKHGRVRRLAGFGQIEISGDVELRLTFENDFFNAIAVPVKRPDHARIERRPFRKSAERAEHPLADIC